MDVEGIVAELKRLVNELPWTPPEVTADGGVHLVHGQHTNRKIPFEDTQLVHIKYTDKLGWKSVYVVLHSEDGRERLLKDVRDRMNDPREVLLVWTDEEGWLRSQINEIGGLSSETLVANLRKRHGDALVTVERAKLADVEAIYQRSTENA